MKAELLLVHFDRVSDAPDAIPQLRRFILDLAVRGKLVDQCTEDEPAQILIDRIATTKAQLQGDVGISRQRVERLGSAHAPFNIPPNWIWVQLGDICSKTGSGSTPRGGKSVYQQNGVPFLRSQNVYDEGLRLDDVAYIAEETHEKMSGTAVQPGDLLLNITGGSIGRCCTVSSGLGPANVSQHVAIIRLAVEGTRAYLHRLILSPYFQSFVLREQTGAGRGGLPKNRMDRIPVALPPQAEQHRILAKLGELMGLCDRLAVAQTEREGQRHRLAKATLHRISNRAQGEDIKAQIQFYFSHLSDVTAYPGQITELREAILDLAVRGQLVPQNSSEEGASESLKRIQAEKCRRIVEGTLRKEKPLPPITEDEIPFAIPESWSWARIGSCSLLTEYGTSVKSDNIGNGVPVLAMGDVQGGQVILSRRKRVPAQIEDLPQLYLKRFDLLYNRTNSAELVGKTGIFMGEDDAFTFASYLIRIRFLNDLTSPVFVNTAMNAPYFRPTQIVPELRQQCGQANVNGSKLRNMLIPLPPFAEQQRIVAKVAELMTICDRLEAQLATARSERGRLLEAILKDVLDDDQRGMLDLAATRLLTTVSQ